MARTRTSLWLFVLISATFAAVPSPATAAPAPAPAAATKAAAATYTNPVSAGTVDTFPDPAIIKGKDGKWWSYGTTNPIFNSRGETGEHILPTLSSTDLVHWTYAGDVFPLTAKPSWWPAGTRPWAPDIRYYNNAYRLTYSLSVGGIGLATSPGPNGPWTDRGRIVPAASGCPSGTIDQAMFTDTDGSYYLYWGSYDTICVARMNDDGTAIAGAVTQIGHGRRMEGGFVVHRDGYYYLFYSDGGCCDGAFSGYTVKVGRATSPLGPFTTPTGVALTDLTSKDGDVLAATGNGWVGPGHNSLVTDLAGQDWLVYHAIPQTDPDFPPVTGANGATLNLTKRPLMIDRLDWINGWPTVRAGAGPSRTAQPAPVTTWTVGSTFDSGSAGFTGGFTWSGGLLTTAAAATSLSGGEVSGNVRVEGDVRGTAAGISYGPVTAWLDSASGRLVVDGAVSGSAALPANFNYQSWHTIVLTRRGSSLTVTVSADRLSQDVATVTLPVSFGGGKIGAVSRTGSADVDNLGAAPLFVPVTQRVTDPRVGALLPAFSDEFNGTAPNAGWSWVRPDATATVSGGFLVRPTQAGDLALGQNSAGVLVRNAPSTPFVVETRVQFDGVRGNQQAGIVLYDNDDRFLKLAHSVLPLSGFANTFLQQTEFTKEDRRASNNTVSSGPTFGGPAPQTMWLRLLYRDGVARMASSRDGVTWTWGAAWTMARPLRIGVVAMGGTGATGRFDYVRTYAAG
ncbi:family 43 glycosylhydrolase [Actinoplanes bogorensis]|uniref:Family 43 glycosylhydrolase n=1 Tax=Paractinoplanes bogorensis TaxID=1610840 RepID=A0ABS5YVL8_9ACTN|nr:family 43 glycosylhydrolase [Actinoplanes bogorensis]MBU2667495.1 family 43 glycosylhydrolase [Actinoplanes bogorensis]